MTKELRGIFSLAAMLALGLVLGYAGTSLLASPGGAGTMMGPGSHQNNSQVQMGPGGMMGSGGMMGGGMMCSMMGDGMMGSGMMGMMGGMMGHMMSPEKVTQLTLKHEMRFHGNDPDDLEEVLNHTVEALRAANEKWDNIPTPSKTELRKMLEEMTAKRSAMSALMQWFMQNHQMMGGMMGGGMMGGPGMMGGSGMHQGSGSR